MPCRIYKLDFQEKILTLLLLLFNVIIIIVMNDNIFINSEFKRFSKGIESSITVGKELPQG